MAVLADLDAAAHLRPILDRSYPLDDVTAALQRLHSATAHGRNLLTP